MDSRCAVHLDCRSCADLAAYGGYCDGRPPEDAGECINRDPIPAAGGSIESESGQLADDAEQDKSAVPPPAAATEGRPGAGTVPPRRPAPVPSIQQTEVLDPIRRGYSPAEQILAGVRMVPIGLCPPIHRD